MIPWHALQSFTRSSARLCALSFLLLMLAGCQMFRGGEPEPTPPDYLRVSRFAASDLARSGGNWQQALAQTYIGLGEAELPRQAQATTATTTTQPLPPFTGVSDPFQQATTLAAARRNALRNLAREVLATTDTAGTTLRELLTAHSSTLATLDAVLGTRARLENLPPEAGVVRARAAIDGADVASALRINDLAPPPSPAELGAARERAMERALEEAKAQLRTDLLETTVSQGRTFGAKFANNEAVMNEFEAMIFVLQPDSVNYAPDGSARLELYFDRNQVRDLARRNSGSRFNPLRKF